MLCVDSDRPDEYMIHSWGLEKSVAFLFDAAEGADGVISLKAKGLLRPAENGALFFPSLNKDELAVLAALTATLRRESGSLRGTWCAPDGIERALELNPGPVGTPLVAAVCNSWTEFKQWAAQSRQTLDAAYFRGHGSSAFELTTSLHRAGRSRLDRYCAETLQQFHAQAEAALDMRLNMNDGADYAVVLGLGQHHGLPTPLLDWTESPYIAAFFAFADALEGAAFRSDATHVRIFALTRKFVSGASPSQVVLPYISPYACALDIVPRHNQRLLAQQGRFLVTNVVNLELFISGIAAELGEKLLHAIDIPISAASEALEDLAYMGVTAATMFPGLDGICRKLRHQMAFSRRPMPEAGKPAGELAHGVEDGGAEQGQRKDAAAPPDPGAALTPAKKRAPRKKQAPTAEAKGA